MLNHKKVRISWESPRYTKHILNPTKTFLYTIAFWTELYHIARWKLSLILNGENDWENHLLNLTFIAWLCWMYTIQVFWHSRVRSCSLSSGVTLFSENALNKLILANITFRSILLQCFEDFVRVIAFFNKSPSCEMLPGSFFFVITKFALLRYRLTS